jgi:hypothetical protein
MGAQFETYSPTVQLGVSWDEQLELVDSDGVAVDISDYDVVAQFHADTPARDSGAAVPDPVFELTTASYHAEAPDYPSFTGFVVDAPETGVIELFMTPTDLWTASPTNVKNKLRWSVVLVNDAGYTIPVASGRVTFLPNNTVIS